MTSNPIQQHFVVGEGSSGSSGLRKPVLQETKYQGDGWISLGVDEGVRETEGSEGETTRLGREIEGGGARESFTLLQLVRNSSEFSGEHGKLKTVIIQIRRNFMVPGLIWLQNIAKQTNKT